MSESLSIDINHHNALEENDVRKIMKSQSQEVGRSSDLDGCRRERLNSEDDLSALDLHGYENNSPDNKNHNLKQRERTESFGGLYRTESHQSRHTHQHEGIDEVLHVFDLHAPAAKYAWNAEHTKIFRNGGHLEENWLNEFLDLILVAALIKLGDGLHYCGLTYEEYFFVAVEFFLLFKTRYMMDEFMWHFYMDDLWNQILYFSFLCGVFIMTLMVSYTHIDDGTGTYHHECSLESFHMNLFYAGLITTRIVLSMYWGVELVFDEEARDTYYMLPIRNFVSIILAIIGLSLNLNSDDFRPFDHYYILMAIAISEYYLNFYKAIHRKPLIDFNMVWPMSLLNMKRHDHDHEKLFSCDEELKAVQERCGQFMLVVLGESMIQLLIPSFESEHRQEMLTLTLFGLLLVWCVAKQFFDAAQRVPNDHALRRCMQSGILWMVMHSVAGWFTFLLGVGLKLLYDDLRSDEVPSKPHLYAVSYGCGGAVVSFTIMRFLHKGWGTYPQNRPRLLGYTLRFFIAFVHFSVVWWPLNDPEYVVVAHCAVAVILNSLDLYNYKSSHLLESSKPEAINGNGSDEGTSDSSNHDATTGNNADGPAPKRINSSTNITGWVAQGFFQGRVDRVNKRKDAGGGKDSPQGAMSRTPDRSPLSSPLGSSSDLYVLGNTDSPGNDQRQQSRSRSGSGTFYDFGETAVNESPSTSSSTKGKTMV
jgi:hypothetical protein